jgi:phosphate transport system substrate-binding protein
METVRVAGTGASLGLMRTLAQEFSRQRPDIRVSVVATLGSSGSIVAVRENAIDLGVSSRPLNQEETESGLKSHSFASTPFVIAANPEVAVPGLSLQQLAAIFTGESARWPDGVPVRLILRPQRDFDTGALRRMSEEMNRAVTFAQGRHGLTVAITDQDSADALEKVPGSLGTSSLALIVTEGRKIKPLAIDGVAPSVEGLRTGVYPFAKPLLLVTSGSPTAATQAFIAFLRSPATGDMLARYGALTASGGP